MKIIFFGTPQFACPFLTALIDDPFFDIVGIISQPDKPSGRGNTIKPTPTKQLGIKHTIPVFQFASLKTDEAVETLSTLQADACVVVAYGKLIPTPILNLTPNGCINVHPSLLPRHRGPSPMQWTLLEGDKEAGISIMHLDEGMDTGPVYTQTTIELDPRETYTTLVEQVASVGPTLLTDTLKDIQSKNVAAVAQNNEEATLTRLLKKEDGHIDWNKTSVEIDQTIRAFEAFPGTWSLLPSGQRLKLISATPTSQIQIDPGVIQQQDDVVYVGTGDGALQLITVQPEGKKPMSATAFLNGYSDITGATLG